MSIKSIFTPFLDKEKAKTAFQSAGVIAHKFNAHISAVFMRQRPLRSGVVYFPLGGSYPADDDDTAKRVEEQNAGALRLHFDDLCDQYDVGIVDIADHNDARGATASWRDLKGRLPHDLARSASACDLIVVASAGQDDNSFHDYLVEELIFASGRPVFVCPETTLSAFPQRIVVAWDGGVESTAAVAAALPFMKEASMVKLLSVHEATKKTASTSDLAASLRLHGVETTETDVELEKGQSDIDVLVHEIIEANADMLVMGGYSHSRWREMVLGGFTHHMLRNSAMPILMAR